MYFSKIALRRDAALTTYTARGLTGDGYRSHQVLWRLFEKGKQQQRDFLYRHVDSTSWPCFFLVSTHRPQDERGVWTIQVKDYAPRLMTGQRLAFSLRANPVVTKPGQHGKPVRHDVIMNAKKQRQSHQSTTIHQGTLLQDIGRPWLEARAAKHGFRLELVRVDGYQQHHVRKSRAPSIRFSTLDFNGLLTVTEPEPFQHALFYGIGPAKGFGCGMLLIRRAEV